jgi:ribonuclease BN (tRNA processing enzyme)
MTNFTIKFRGVRGSYPTAKSNFLKFGGNTSCVEVKCGKQLIILDSGTGIIEIGNDVAKNNYNQKQTTIILSHIHQDHIQGLQFYKPLFNQDSKINLFGLNKKDEDLKSTLNNFLFDTVFPLNLYEIKSDFKINNFSEEEVILIYQDGKTEKVDYSNKNIKTNENVIKITSHKTPHPKDGCLCIKIEYNNKTLIYATDRENFEDDDGFIDFAKNTNCLIHDAQYTLEDYNSKVFSKKGFGHSTFEMAIDVFNKTYAKKMYLYHYDPDYDDKKLENLEKQYAKNNIIFAKENLECEL